MKSQAASWLMATVLMVSVKLKLNGLTAKRSPKVEAA